MNFFKRPFVAVLLTVLIVVCSTLVSINVKLESKCGAVSDIFYEGVRISGVEYPAMAEPMKQLCALTDDIILIANNYGIDTGELSQRLDVLELAMQYSADDVNYIGSCYGDYFKALSLHHSEQAMKAQREVTDVTNELLTKNAQALHQGSVSVAREAERGIVDLETLKKTNQELIATLDEVRQIQDDGRARRAQAEEELGRIEGELKQKLLDMKG